jgi:DNA uptake protein ComE-like DNA-binding protein
LPIASAQDMSDIIEQDITLPRTTLIQVTLDELYENPINLNTASYDEILKIPYLTPILAQSIFEYAYKKGFSSKFDLLRIRYC